MSAVLKSIPKRQPRTVIYTEVEHEISEWGTEDLIAELQRRGQETTTFGHEREIEQMCTALKLGREQEALETLRKYLMDVTGRIL